MMMPKHTPGAWRVSKNAFRNLFIQPDCEGIERCDVIASLPSTPDRDANAALIAAAPDLFEAAREVVAWYDEYMRDDRIVGERERFIAPLVAALAKAEGA
jgi:hypothetical protein